MLLGLAAVGCWSTVATAFKIALEYADIFQLVFYATLTSTVFLTSLVLIRETRASLVDAYRQHLPVALMGGAINPLAYYLILFTAYDLLPAQVAMAINYSWAIVLTLMAILFLKQRMLLADGIAAVVCYGGVVIIATQGDFSGFDGASLKGLGFALLSTLLWAGYWTLNIYDSREPLIAITMNFQVALPMTAAACFLFSSFSLEPMGLLACGYVGLVEMGIAFVLWSAALNLTENASRVSNLIFLSPFVSLIIIHQTLGEEIYFTTLAGLVLIIAGLLGQQIAHRRAGIAT